MRLQARMRLEPRHAYSISTVLALIVTVGICAVIGLYSVWSITSLVERVESEALEELASQGRVIAAGASVATREQGIGAARRFIEAMDTDNTQFSSNWIAWSARPPPGFAADTATWHAFSNGRTVALRAVGELVHYAPVRRDHEVVGVLRLSMTRGGLDARVANIVRQRLFGAVLLVVVCAGLVLVSVRVFVARPLATLVAYARQIAHGDLTRRIAPERLDEIGHLASEMNQMTESLHAARQAMIDESEERTRMQAQLRHAERLKTVGQLASGFAHELGTPLNVILGRARMIARGQVKDEALIESAEIIGQQARRVADLMRHLLTFARRRPSPTGPLDLRAVLRNIEQLVQPVTHKRRVTLTLHMPEVSCMARGDAGQIEQVVANLVMNAVDAMPSGGPVDVILEKRHARHPQLGVEGPWYALTVTDRGPGVPADLRERIFEPFFTTKEVGAGTGLGLSVAYGIVRDHEGWIEVAEAQPGEGAQFVVFLPIPDETPPRPSATTDSLPAIEDAGDGDGMV